MNPNFEREFTFDRVIRIIIGALILIGLFVSIHYLRNVLVPFLLAWLIAYLLYPLVRFIQYRLKFKVRILAILAALILVTGVFTGIVTLLVGPVSNEISHMAVLLKEFVSSGENHQLIPDAWEQYIRQNLKGFDIQSVLSLDAVGKYIEKAISQGWKIFSGSLNFIFSLLVVFIILLYIVFILLDYEVLSQGWKKLIPEKYRDFVVHMADDIEVSMNKYFRGQALIAFTVGILFATGFYIIDLPLGILLGLFIGVLNLVPYLQTVGFIPLTFLAVLKAMESDQSFGMVMLSVFIVFAIVQGFQESFLIPRIMGKQMGLHPAIILLSLTIWGSILGLVGMIIALPFTTLIISYYRRFILMEKEDQAVTTPNEGESTSL